MDKRVRDRRRKVTRERGRRRAGLIFLGVLVVVAAIAFLWLRSSSVFAVERITAPVTHHVTKEQIADAVAPARGVSLLKLSPGKIEDALASLPYVKTVHVYRVFPNGLEVRLDEYEPAARITDGAGRTWLVSDDGRLLEKAGQAATGLPLIVSGSEFQARAGETLPEALMNALPVARLLETPDLAQSLPALDHITVSSGGNVVVVLEGATEIRLGEPADLKRKMMDAAALIQKYLRDGKVLEYVDASAGDRLAVKAK